MTATFDDFPRIDVRVGAITRADFLVKLASWFIRDADDATFEGKRWDHFLEEWEKRIPQGGRFVDIQAVVQTLEDLTAREYVESYPLDLHYLSTRDG